MTILILGASGATGKLLVEQMLQSPNRLKLIVRSSATIPPEWKSHSEIELIEAPVSEMSTEQMAKHLRGCEGVACCLGHNISIKGIWGEPHKLVTDAIKLVYAANQLNSPHEPLRFVLMGTVGYVKVNERVSKAEQTVLQLMRLLLPPMRDNETAAGFLAARKQNDKFQWVVVRPDSLINQNETTAYSLHFSPTRSAIFNSGKTSRINVANLMARLLSEESLWEKWKEKMPVIYNREYE